MSTSLASVMGPPTIVATITNDQGIPAIYITSDPSVNDLTLTVTNNTGADLTFPAGSPAAPDDLPSGQSNLYLFFNGLLESTSVEALSASVAGGGWSVSALDQAGVGYYLAFGPESAVTLPDGQSLSIQISNLTTNGQGQPGGNVSLSWRNIETIDDGSYLTFLSIAPEVSEGGPNYPPLSMGFIPDNTIVADTYTQNRISLYLTNTRTTQLVPGDWGSSTPEFRLYFVPGSSPGALTDQSHLNNITVNPASRFASTWSVTPELNAATPYWSLKPTSGVNQQILGIYAAASVVFEIDNIFSSVGEGVTPAYVQWLNIPGYDDGFRALDVVTLPAIGLSFTASQHSGTPPLNVTFTFSISNATYVTVSNTTYAVRFDGELSSRGLAVTVNETTTFTLTAINERTGQVQSSAITITCDPVVPAGSIMLWSGAGNAIPAGWALCDGTAYNDNTFLTPDLRDRFVCGADSAYPGVSSPAWGGPDTHYHSLNYSQTLSGTTGAAGSHTHQMNFHASHHYSVDSSPNASRPYYLYFDSSGKSTGTTDTQSDHTHSVSLQLHLNNVSTSANTYASDQSMRPKYYQLCYIIKLP